MGLITGLFMLPLAPVRGVIWLGERVLDQAECELNSPETIYQRLEEIDEAPGQIQPAHNARDVGGHLPGRL